MGSGKSRYKKHRDYFNEHVPEWNAELHYPNGHSGCGRTFFILVHGGEGSTIFILPKKLKGKRWTLSKYKCGSPTIYTYRPSKSGDCVGDMSVPSYCPDCVAFMKSNLVPS